MGRASGLHGELHAAAELLTGATWEQIEAIAGRLWNEVKLRDDATWESACQESREWYLRLATDRAAEVVPPGSFIGTPELRAAIGRALFAANVIKDWSEGRVDQVVLTAQVIDAAESITDADLARLEAIANGGAS